MSARMKLVVAYLGTPFAGWQRQQDQPTVQGELERALAQITGGRAGAVVGAGRTDAGVHAAGQVAHCDLPERLPPAALVRALNAVLPPAIRIRAAARVDPDFHARSSARGKLYTFRASWREPLLPWLGLRVATVAPVDVDALGAALRILPGTRDWASFTVPEPGPDSTVRTLFRVDLRRRREGFEADFVGDGFLRYQVRRMMGAALEVAGGLRSPEDLRSLTAEPRPGAAIRTAAAGGLSLERVYYRSGALGRSP